MLLHASCHCGAVRLEIRRRPRTLTECNCSIRRRYAARWAYYSRKSVRIRCAPGDLSTYTYGRGTFLYHFCRRCGCLTHYARIHTSNDERLAVNARMMDPQDIDTVPIRKLDVRKNRK